MWSVAQRAPAQPRRWLLSGVCRLLVQIARSDAGLGNNAGMPKVFEKDGYRFFFYSNEHRPIHVHVRYGAGEAVFNIEPIIELRESVGLKVRELSHAEGLARTHRALIIQKWHEHLNR